jgi:hypothetical protein
MNGPILFEGILLIIISFVAIAEGIRLVAYKDAGVLFDPLGPGFYILILSTLLMVVGFLHLIINYRKNIDIEKATTNREMKKRMIHIIAALAIYISLIYLIGYFGASIIFFLMIFRILGMNSWPVTILLSLLFTACFYILFVYFGRVVFPLPIFPIPIAVF